MFVSATADTRSCDETFGYGAGVAPAAAPEPEPDDGDGVGLIHSRRRFAYAAISSMDAR